MTTAYNKAGAADQKPMAANNDAALSVLKQLEQLLLEENAALQNNERVDHTHFIERKNQILRELIIIQRTASVNPEFLSMFEELKGIVTRNQQILQTNILAVKEVADILKTAVLEEEEDGTYSQNERRRGVAT